jgi:hypothetical protein
MAYDTLYALYLTPILLFQQKRQVLEPIKMSHGHLKAQCHQGTQLHECFASFVLVLISLATSL